MVGWLTVIFAATAVGIAAMQWFLARQRFVLDLFDRRFKAYNDVLDSFRAIIGAGVVEHNQIVDLRVAVSSSKFLFGSDVNDLLQEVISTSAKLRYWGTIYNTANAKAHEAPEGIENCSTRLLELFESYADLCQVYMMMPEKRVRTPLEWLQDRNSIRKSYGAEEAQVKL